jgi:hypothetical protein
LLQVVEVVLEELLAVVVLVGCLLVIRQLLLQLPIQ